MVTTTTMMMIKSTFNNYGDNKTRKRQAERGERGERKRREDMSERQRSESGHLDEYKIGCESTE